MQYSTITTKAMRKADKKLSKRDAVVKILQKVGKALDEVLATDLTKKELALIVDYVTENGSFPVPTNLQN